MAINFPTGATLNQIYTYNNRSWKWNGVAWDLTNTGTALVVDSSANANYVQIAGSSGNLPVNISALGTGTNVGVNINTKGTGTFTVNGLPVQGGGGLTVSTTAPSSPQSGDKWLNSNTGIMYVYTNDGNSSAWVDFENSGGQFDSSTWSNSFNIGDTQAGTKSLNFTNNVGLMSVQSTHTASRTLTLPDDTSTIATQYNLGLRNKIINGKMEIAQRGTSFSFGTGSGYTLDRWAYEGSHDGVVGISQQADVPSSNEFQNSLRATVATADTSIAAGQYCMIEQHIEGYNARDLNGRTFTISFWVRSAKTGIHCISLRNHGFDRNYVVEYSVIAANTWEYKSVTIVGGLSTASGTWNFTNGAGVRVQWMLACGTTFQTSANTWVAGTFLGTTNQVNVLDTVGNIFALTGVQVELGSVATQFEHRPTDYEYFRCMRYYERRGPSGSVSNERITTTCLVNGAANVQAPIQYLVPKRAVPTLNVGNVTGSACYDGAGAIAVTSWAVDNVGTYIANIQLSVPTQTLGRASHWTYNNNNTLIPYVEIIAEL